MIGPGVIKVYVREQMPENLSGWALGEPISVTKTHDIEPYIERLNEIQEPELGLRGPAYWWWKIDHLVIRIVKGSDDP